MASKPLPRPETEPAPKAKRNRNLLGQSRIFTPEVIDDIHIKAELGRYRMRGFSLFKKIPHWDDLTFLPGHPDALRDRGLPREVHHQDGAGAAREAADGAGHPGLHHRHELRRARPTRPRSHSRAVPPWPARPPARARGA